MSSPAFAYLRSWNRKQDGPPPVEWDQAPLAWPGPALVDLHDGRGTTWRKTAGGFWPDCRCHGQLVRRGR